MSAIAIIKFQIRRALEGRLDAICDANGFPLDLPGRPLDRNNKPVFVKQSISWGDVDVLEVGPSPRFRGNGGYTVVVCTPGQDPLDRNDEVAGIIAAGYPYGVSIEFNGISVMIDKIRPGAYGVDAAWRTGMFTIDWNIYRRP